MMRFLKDLLALKNTPLILLYNSCFGSYPDYRNFDCEVSCKFTTNRRHFEEADAVVFHLPTLEQIPRQKRQGQLWVGWSMESRAHTPIRSNPVLMRYFDLSMNVERDADVWCPYLPSQEDWTESLSSRPAAKTAADPIALFQSAAKDTSGRNGFASELMRHMPVSSYGQFMNNRAMPAPDLGTATKMQVIRHYPFCLGLENTIERDYVTEKFFQPLLAGSVPVYRGAPNVDDFAPGDHCYIDAASFEDARSLAAYLLDLTHDPGAYAWYHEWRSKPLREEFVAMTKASGTEAFCRLARLVASRRGAPERSGSAGRA